MSQPTQPFDYSRLSPAERILLAEDLWDSVASEQDVPPLTLAQKEEMQRRLTLADEGKMNYSPWEQVKQRLFDPK